MLIGGAGGRGTGTGGNPPPGGPCHGCIMCGGSGGGGIVDGNP